MINNIKYSAIALFIALAIPGLANAQFVTQDWALHDVGQVIQILTNRGAMNKENTDYPGLLNTEYPPKSFVEHFGKVGWYIGGITPEGDTLVSVTASFASSQEFRGFSSAPWDTVWEVDRGDTVNIGGGPGEYYEKNYSPVSDQDMVTRYNDYNDASQSISSHNPLYLDVIQKSYAWGSPPLDKMIIFNYEIVPQKFDIHKVFIANFVDGNVGLRTGSGFTFADDDYARYYPKHHMAITFDAPGGPDGGEYTPVGSKFVLPQNVNKDSLTWTWIWGDRSPVVPPSRDPDRYEQMSSGEIRDNQVNPNQVHYILSYGPMELSKGDTLRFKIAVILGENEDDILNQSEIVNRLVPDFNVPSPPPNPPLHFKTKNRSVELDWDAQSGELNPENYADPNRADSSKKPFEGYRVYKSTQSKAGPWTLLGEYDISGNKFGRNTGLKHKFTDTGLLNNIDYYYSVTAFSKRDTVLDWPEQESSIRANAVAVSPGTPPPGEVGEVAAVPNPYRGDIDYNATNPPWEKPPSTRERWLEQDRRIQFINMPSKSQLKIFTLSGKLVQTINHNDPDKGFEDWNLTSNVGQAVASGIYLFTVKNLKTGKVQTGKFVIIK